MDLDIKTGTYCKSGEQRSSARNCPYSRTPFIQIDGAVVVRIDEASTGACTQSLGQDVSGYLFPRKSTENSLGQGDCRVEVSALY
jgi:hypothetical protein